MFKSLMSAAAVTLLLATIAGCSYVAPAVAGDKVVIAKNNAFLFGVLNTVYVCKITDKGLTACADNESP